MPGAVRALRGATTVEKDTPDEIEARVLELLARVVEHNEIDHEDLIRLLFTATEDLTSAFPATAARAYGFGDVPLICARELSVEGGMERCVRVLIHLTTPRSRSELHHVYLHGARNLRDDLPE
jgi:chorismate mutase